MRAFRFIQKGRAGASLSLCISCNLVANDRPDISRHIPGYPVTFPSVIPCPFSHACPSVAWVQSYADERCQGLGVIYQACSFLYLGFHESPLSELDGEVYHKLLLTAHKLTSRRGAYLAANIDRAKQISLRQYRYIRFLKTDWIKRLRMPVLPYPKRQPD